MSYGKKVKNVNSNGSACIMDLSNSNGSAWIMDLSKLSFLGYKNR